MIVGLGNPGREYENTKHNTGFMTVDALAADMGADRWQQKMAALVASVSFRGETILLVKPQTYMNDSGRAVGPLMRWYKLAEPQVYIVYDDMDLPVGRLRIRKSGSDGGHNGIKSIFANGCTEFIRFRIGIGRPYFGGQKFNRVFAEAANRVSTGYRYLPFEVYSRSDFRSTIGQAYDWSRKSRARLNVQEMIDAGITQDDGSQLWLPDDPGPRISLKDGLKLWSKDLQEYGYNQGFIMR